MRDGASWRGAQNRLEIAHSARGLALNRFVSNLKGLGTMRLAGIAAVGLIVLGIVGAVALRGSTQPMALLYGDMELHDSAQVAATLDKLRVPYEVRADGAQILVPSNEVDRLRLSLAREGLPAGGSVGYEVFDRADSLTSNQFQQQMNQLRALEGELARTIRSIRGVRNVRVHLVLPKREPFAREQQQAQASVVLATAGLQRMGDDEVQAIVNLVATAVPGLKPENISIVDSRGQLLARSGRSTNSDGSSHNDEARRAMEHRLSQSIEDMLSRTLGPGHVRAEASVEMDFARVSETQEKYDPDGQVVRRQQSVTDTNKSTEAPASVSVQNNLPNPEGPSGGAGGSANNHQQEETTFEIGKTVRTVVRDSPQVKKISMAVLVDGTTTQGADGKPTWRELSAPDIDRIAALVRSAIGFDEKRGDKVEVVNMRFSEPDDLGVAETTAPGWLNIGKAEIMWLVTIGLITLVALFALGFVVRPLALKLAIAVPATEAVRSVTAPVDAATGLASPSTAALLPGSPAADSAEQHTMLNVPNIQGEVRATSIRALGELVQNHQDAAVTVIRGWLTQKAS